MCSPSESRFVQPVQEMLPLWTLSLREACDLNVHLFCIFKHGLNILTLIKAKLMSQIYCLYFKKRLLYLSLITHGSNNLQSFVLFVIKMFCNSFLQYNTAMSSQCTFQHINYLDFKWHCVYVLVSRNALIVSQCRIICVQCNVTKYCSYFCFSKCNFLLTLFPLLSWKLTVFFIIADLQ